MSKFVQKLKSLFTLSIVIDIALIAVIIITTLFPTLFDPEHADWKTVFSNFILSIIIALLSFTSRLAKSKINESNKEKYTTARNNHIGQVRKIQERQLSKSQELYVKDYNKKSLIEYAKEVFNQYEIPFELYTCDISLVKTALNKGVIDKNQYSVIKLCRRGKLRYTKYNIRDLTSTQILKNKTNSTESQQVGIVVTNLLSKISWMLAGVILIGTFVPDAMSEGGVTAQSWINLASRILTYVGGLYCGDQTGKEIIEDDIRLYDLYYNFNCQFLQDFDLGVWKPSEEEIKEDIITKLQRLHEEEEKPKPQYKEIEITKEQLEMLQQKPTL